MKNCSFRQFLVLLTAPVLLLLLGIAPPALAEHLVTAAYLQAQGRQLTIELQIGSPPPPTLIIIQNLPPGTAIAQAEPPTKSVNTAKGEAKWLLKNVTAGPLTLRLLLDREVSAAEISGEIRYLEPASGAMVELPISHR